MSCGRRILALQCPGFKLLLVEVKTQDGVKLDSWNLVGVHRVLVGKPEGTLPLGRPRRRWEDNIKMDLQEVGGGSWGLDGVGSG